SLRSVLGENVRRVSESSKLLAIRADRRAFEAIRETASIKRVSFDMMMGPMLDKSRLNIKADKVHCPNSGTPYTGADVKVAIVDSGIAYNHPRLPAATTGHDWDFSTDDDDCRFPGNSCVYQGHGTQVAGVIFCQPDADPCGNEGDGLVGIAYGATPVNAKVAYGNPGGQGGSCFFFDGYCPPEGCSGQYETESWARTLPAFYWAVADAQGPQSHVINYSRGFVAIGDPDEGSDTSQDSPSALYVDWLVSTTGASFVHSCGNAPAASELSPPSGAFNCISVGAYDDMDLDADGRDQAVIADFTSPGPTDDNRRKPDLCAPGVDIYTTTWDYVCDDYDPPPCINCEEVFYFTNKSGTSFAAPHVSGTVALLLDARSSLTPNEIHAILVNASDFALLPEPQYPPQEGWDDQGGYGMLATKRAVLNRNEFLNDQLGVNESETYYLERPSAGDDVVITCAWLRAMINEDTPVADSPGNLDIFLERRPVEGGDWVEVASSDSDLDNIEQVRSEQPSTGQQYDFRVRVERVDGSSSLSQQQFALASRHDFV
ncbi:MAG: S8 family peptidase, partial [Phycisphaerales bacterium]|nr:S8 family peptidase [Phycisphaerales bacterium]